MENLELGNRYHRSVELLSSCGAEALRELVKKTVISSGHSLKEHLHQPDVYKKFQRLRERNVIRPDQFTLLYPDPSLNEMDVTILSLLIQNGKFRLSADEDRKVQELKKVRNDISHIPKPELPDETLFKKGSYIITEIADASGAPIKKRITSMISEIQKKEVVRCHSNVEIVRFRGETYMTKLIEMPDTPESADVPNTNTTYLRASFLKWADKLPKYLNIDRFSQTLKKESILNTTEIFTTRKYFNKEEQFNDIVLKIADKPDFIFFKFLKTLRDSNPDLADLIENKNDGGKTIEDNLKTLENESIHSALPVLFEKETGGKIPFEELHVAVEEQLCEQLTFSNLKRIVVEYFHIDGPKEDEHSFKDISWTANGKEILHRCSLFANATTDSATENFPTEENLLDMTAERFADYVSSTMDLVKMGYGPLMKDALIQECITPAFFSKLTRQEIEDTFNPYMKKQKLVMGILKRIQEIQDTMLRLSDMKNKSGISEIFDDLRPFDEPSGHSAFKTGKVKVSTGNLLIPVHEFRTLPINETLTTAYIVKETIRFISACMNSRRNGTIHFGIEPDGSSHGKVTGLKCLTEKGARDQLDFHLTKGIGVCFKPSDIQCIQRCIRPYQLVPTNDSSFVLEMDVIPTIASTNTSFFSIMFPPKGQQEHSHFVYNEEIPCEIVFVPKDRVKETNRIYSQNVKNRQRLENNTHESLQQCSTVMEKLKLRLTAGYDYCTEQHIPIVCIGSLSGVNNEKYIREQISTHCTDVLLSAKVVFDFDRSTKQRKVAETDFSLQYLVKTTDAAWDRNHEEADRYWIYCNGNADLNISHLPDNEWYKSRFPVLQDMVTWFRQRIPKKRAIFICLVFDTMGNLNPMMEFIEECMKLHFRNECVVLADSEEKIKHLKENIFRRMTADENVEKHFYSGIDWRDIAMLLRGLFRSPTRSDIRLPCSDGKEVFLSKQQLSEMKLSDIEILSGRLCLEEDEMDDETRQNTELCHKEKFYRGEDVSWWNFHYNSHVGERTFFNHHLRSIREKLKQERERRLVETKTILHQPGSGGSTTGKYMLWHLSQFKYRGVQEAYRCCIIKAISDKTSSQIYDFMSFEDPNPKPVVALLDNESDINIETLKEDLNEIAYKKLHSNSTRLCLLIIIKRVPVSHQNKEEPILSHQLTSQEKTWFENKYKELENNEHIDVRTLISFNVMREGFDQKYVEELAKSFLKDVTNSEIDILSCLALINMFDMDNAVPISVFDCLNQNSNTPYHQTLHQYADKGPIGLVVPMANKTRKITDVVWSTDMSESFSLLIKRSHGRTARSSDQLQHNGVMIISQVLAKSVVDNIMLTRGIVLSQVIEDVFKILKIHVQEVNPMSKEFVRIINGLFKTRQTLSDKWDTKAKFSDMVLELKNRFTDENNDGGDTVVRLMKLCFDITSDAMVGQQLSRFYIDMSRFTDAEIIIKQSIKLQTSSYLYDTYGLVFSSKMVYLLDQQPHEPMSIDDESASEIIETAFKALEKFIEGQNITIQEERGNMSCHVNLVKTSFDLLEKFYRLSCQQSHEQLLSFLNSEEVVEKDMVYQHLQMKCPLITQLKRNRSTHMQIETSLRMLEEGEYQLKKNLYTVNTSKGEQLLLSLRERFERFYGNENVRSAYEFYHGIGLKSIMTVHENDFAALQMRVDDAALNISDWEKTGKLKKVDTRDLLVYLGFEIVEMSLKSANEEAVMPMTKYRYSQLLKYAEALLELQRRTHRPHLEAYLYFAILNWPSETREAIDILCKPDFLKNTIEDWEKKFQLNFKKEMHTQKRKPASPKTYFALGNRGLGCDIVDSRKVEDMWRKKRDIKRNYVMNDQVLKEPFVVDVLKRFEGTLNDRGTVVKYEVKRKYWEYSIEIKTYTPTQELGNRRVTFVLLFSWSGPRAHEIMELDENELSPRELVTQDKTRKKTKRTPPDPSARSHGNMVTLDDSNEVNLTTPRESVTQDERGKNTQRTLPNPSLRSGSNTDTIDDSNDENELSPRELVTQDKTRKKTKRTPPDPSARSHGNMVTLDDSNEVNLTTPRESVTQDERGKNTQRTLPNPSLRSGSNTDTIDDSNASAKPKSTQPYQLKSKKKKRRR